MTAVPLRVAAVNTKQPAAVRRKQHAKRIDEDKIAADFLSQGVTGSHQEAPNVASEGGDWRPLHPGNLPKRRSEPSLIARTLKGRAECANVAIAHGVDDCSCLFPMAAAQDTRALFQGASAQHCLLHRFWGHDSVLSFPALGNGGLADRMASGGESEHDRVNTIT
jgi:hypothetical protein